MTKRRILVSSLPYKASLPVEKQIPLPMPNTVISFERKLSTEEEQAIQKLGAIVIPAKKDVESNRYRFPEGILSSDGLKAILQHPKKVNHYTITAYGQANLAAVLAFLKVKAIFTLFIKTQHYPAFMTREEAEEADAVYRDPFVQKRARDETGKGKSAKRIRPSAEPQGRDVEMHAESDEEEEDDDDARTETHISTGEDIPRAPPPSIDHIGWGRPALAPKTYGSVFPYFDGLLDDDTNFVSRVVNDYFLLSLGSTTKECSLEGNAIRGGMGQFASSNLGRIMTHIAAGVRLAIQAQTMLYLHLTAEGRYSGFSLHGAGYTINIQGRLYDAADEAEMQHDLARADEHTKALAEILKVAADVIGKKTVGVPRKKTKVTDVTSARELHHYLRQLNLDDDRKQMILASAAQLSFPERPWRMSIDNVIDVITHLCDGTDLPSDAPMYLGGGTLLSENPVVRAMSVFGELGFSFRTPNGTRFKLPESRAADTLYKETKDAKGKSKKPMRTFVIQKKGLESCASDWLAFLADRILEVKEQRSSAFKSEVFGGEAGRRLWMHLIDVIPVVEKGPGYSAKDVELAGEKEGREKELDFADFL
jgi:hypothetical protein